MSRCRIKRPAREAVVRIAREESEAAGACPDAVLGLNRPSHFDLGVRNVTARHRAWARIISETGCSQYGLSLVWGCDRKAIRLALKKQGAAA